MDEKEVREFLHYIFSNTPGLDYKVNLYQFNNAVKTGVAFFQKDKCQDTEGCILQKDHFGDCAFTDS